LKEVSLLGQQWLKCKCFLYLFSILTKIFLTGLYLDALVQIVIWSYLTKYQELNCFEKTTLKYTCEYLIYYFDCLHQKAEFATVSVEDFPLHRNSNQWNTVSRVMIDVNNDSDRAIGE
jgi:hypothetical protein